MKSCPGYISGSVRCRKLILDLTFDLAILTSTYKILSEPYLENCEEKEVHTWPGHWLGVIGVQYHGVILI